MGEMAHRISVRSTKGSSPDLLLGKEWLVTNGLGGFASGSSSGAITRRYHGLLIAALPAPLGRMVLLNHLSEKLVFADGTTVRIGPDEQNDPDQLLPSLHYLAEFRLEMGLPVWRYEIEGVVLEKRLLMPYRQNTTYLHYQFIAGPWPVRLELRPLVHFRRLETRVNEPLTSPYALSIIGDRYEISADSEMPKLKLRLFGERAAFTFSGFEARQFSYHQEAERGYEGRGTLWNPGSFQSDLLPGRDTTLIVSTESWRTMLALQPAEVRVAENTRRQRLLEMAGNPQGMAAELVLAADQFVISPAGRMEETARANAAGDQVGTVVAGYHWFTDWGRDTMISLEGLTLTTGRHREAGWILRTFAHYIRDGLIPNMFPEGQSDGLYHTADATLWYFHALERYLAVTGDRGTLRQVLPRLREIIDRHRHGTRFGIGIDPRDGLLRQGAEGYQLTWMDAKVGDWVVTPRRGKAVEINALWYNALVLLAGWLREEEETAASEELDSLAQQVRESFNKRFWYSEGGYLYDLVDGEAGDDPACRPNQVFALSLLHPVLDRSRWQAVIDIVQERLLTPLGLRSLAPGHPDYKSKYFGDIHARDAAYHQGTVWGWLIGPFIDAWLRVHPDEPQGARIFLQGFISHLDDAGIGSISEIFDAEPPFTPRGCIAQAWSVAEVLRCLAATS